MDADYLDVDDELMPIEIHEIVSIDEMMKGNPTFVALDDIYIEAFAGELLGDTKKGLEFLGLHKSHVAQRNNAAQQAMKFVTFNVDARRRNNFESAEYLNEWKTLYDNVPYHKYHAEMTRTAMPYQTDDTTLERLCIEPDDKPVSIRLASRDDKGILLPDDTVKLPIIDAKWVPAEFTNESYVFDTTELAANPHMHSVQPDAALHPDMMAFITSLAPKLDDINVGDDGDLHTLKLNLSKNGIRYDDLSQADLDVLAAKLNNIKHKPEPSLVPKHISVSINPLQRRLSKKQKSVVSVFNDKFPEFASAVEAYLDRTGAYLTETRMATLNAMFDAYLSSHPQYSLLEGVDSPFQMAMSLIHSTQDLKDVTQALNDLRTRLDTQLVQEYFGAIHGRNDTQAKDVASALASLVQKQDTGKDFVRLVELESFTDIHKLTKGIDTSMYEGVESFNQVFTETINGAAFGGDDEFDDALDTDEFGLALGMGTGAPIPADALSAFRSVDHMDAPFREILMFADTAGLPWNYHRWLDEAFRDYAFPASRFEALANITSDIAATVLQAIANASDEKAGLMEIAKMSNTTEAAKLAAAYPAIIQEWTSSKRYALIDGLAFWALDTLDASIAGTLDFKIPNNAFGHYWSHLGPPIEPKAARGVFPYIAQVAKVDVSKLLNHATTHYPERIARLLQYKLKDKDKQDNVKQAFMDAMEMHRQNKEKAKFNFEMFLNSFIPMYLHMPSTMVEVVPLKKQPIWAQGCCVVPLNSSYEADADFRYKANTDRKKDTYLYTVKAKLADKRWLKTSRPIMYTLTPSSPPPSNAPVTPTVDLSHHIQPSDSSLPVFDVDVALMDLAQPEHIKEFKDGKFSIFNTRTIELAQRALTRYDNKHFAVFSSVLSSDVDRDLIINLIKQVVVMHKTDSLLDIKRRIAASPNMPRDIARYLLAAAIDKVPVDKRVDTVIEIKNIVSVSSFYTAEEAQDVINKKREESKTLTLSKIDALDREDRELVVAAKKLGVVKYADLQAPPPGGNDTASAFDGAAAAAANQRTGEEYKYRGQDADRNDDDDFDDY